MPTDLIGIHIRSISAGETFKFCSICLPLTIAMVSGKGVVIVIVIVWFNKNVKNCEVTIHVYLIGMTHHRPKWLWCFIYTDTRKNIIYFRLFTLDYHCDGLGFPFKCFPKKIIYCRIQLGSIMKCIYLMCKGSRFLLFWCSIQFYLYKGVATIMWSCVLWSTTSCSTFS